MSSLQELSPTPFVNYNQFDYMSMPMDIALLIFTDLGVKFEDWHNLPLVCKHWKKIFSSEKFAEAILTREGITKKFPTWFKTYHAWLTTRMYILLDCSASMRGIKEFDEQVHTIIMNILSQKTCVEANLGLFANGYFLEKFGADTTLETIITTIEQAISEHKISTNSTEILPIMDKIHDQITEAKQPYTDIHIISDWDFDNYKDVISFIKEKLLVPENITTQCYQIGDVERARNVTEPLKTLIAEQKNPKLHFQQIPVPEDEVT